MDAHELVALCAPRPTFISYGVPENGDAKCLDHQGSYMATVTAGPVFRLLGAKDLGTTDDYRTEKMPAVNVSMMGNQLHSTVKGYQVWADALRPIFEEILGALVSSNAVAVAFRAADDPDTTC